MTNLAIALALIMALCSVVAFAAYGLDKRRAQSSGRRIPENTLHLMALLGGWPGAMWGQKFFRHKTQKTSFRIVFWLCVIAHVVLAAGAFYLVQKLG